jgi:hypothetical protein
MDRQMGIQKERLMNTDKCRHTDGLMDKWTDEWAVGQIDGQMNV